MKNKILCVDDSETVCNGLKRVLTQAPIVMLTTESSAVVKEKGKSLGVKGWITKPYDTEKLLMAINKIVA